MKIFNTIRFHYTDTHERLVHIEDKINGLQKEIESIIKSTNAQGTDTHERLVHIEDKVNILQNLNIQDKKFPGSLSAMPRRENRIHFIRSVDYRNAGDMKCNPMEYFDEFNKFDCIVHNWKDIQWELIGQNDWIILGGGGLLECSDELQKTIIQLLVLSDKVIGWALGHNTHFNVRINFPIDYNRFLLYSVRDYGYKGEEYCPDVSCMSSLLDDKYIVKRRIGIIEHLAFPIEGFSEEKISNRFEARIVIRFIGESEIILTNSWHCAYWGLLLAKKVILYHPFSNKFDSFKYKPVIYSGEDLESDITKAQKYSGLLEEARDMNVAFKNRVLQMMEG